MNKVFELFLQVYESLPAINTDVSWNNGTGYLNNYPKVSAPARFTMPEPNNRRGIILPQGVIFERYTPGLN
jgi:hypothetical protein